jgi:1,4-alpha-glucan branching enzyme
MREVREFDPTELREQDLYFFREGTHARLYDKLGCRLRDDAAHFVVWAPNARAVSVIGDFNGWASQANPAAPRPDGSGLWEADVTGVRDGHLYKFDVVDAHGHHRLKADPFARRAELPPETASVVCADSGYVWGDADWLARRGATVAAHAPMAVYEVHFGSWRRPDGRMPGYREIAEPLAAHAVAMGFTHIEFLPLTEHPFYGSWGYLTTGYFAPASRHGTADDLRYLVDTLHQAGLGVIFDWVPSHFPTDAHGLAEFDGTCLYEHADPRQGFHPDWNSAIFNYGRNEVRAFLLSSAMYWVEEFHADALRVDAVASMLYLDYGRSDGQWIPNRDGGRENQEAIAFLRQLNDAVQRDHPGVQMIAEESTAWPMVSRPARDGGLGFSMKWNMGWMHDTLRYFQRDPVHRRWHQDDLTFSLIYAFNESFLLPLSHDEVVHGKGSLIGKMPGDEWQRFANLRLLYGHMWGHPGKKLLFMGSEFGQWAEWNHDRELDWPLLNQPQHAGLQRWVRDLNTLYRGEPALHDLDFDRSGFEWVLSDDAERSLIAYLRRSRRGESLLVVANFTPVVRENVAIGVPGAGIWRERLNSDAQLYGGRGVGNHGGVASVPLPAQGRFHSLSVRLPPLGIVFLQLEPS